MLWKTQHGHLWALLTCILRKLEDRFVSQIEQTAVFAISHRTRTSFCTCLWVMETWARRQPQWTDWPLLRLHYPCSLPQTSPHQCLLIQCAAAKPATRDGQFGSIYPWMWTQNQLSLFYSYAECLCWWNHKAASAPTGRSLLSQRGSHSSCRTTGRRSAIWCAASTARREHH